MARRIRDYIEPEELERMYGTMTAPEIGEMYGFSESAVRRYLRSEGITKDSAISHVVHEAEELQYEAEEEIRRRMTSSFYDWALTHNVRGGRKVIRKIFDVLEGEPISIQDDGNYQLSTGSYGITKKNKKTFVKLIYDPSQMSITVFMREKEY